MYGEKKSEVLAVEMKSYPCKWKKGCFYHFKIKSF